MVDEPNAVDKFMKDAGITGAFHGATDAVAKTLSEKTNGNIGENTVKSVLPWMAGGAAALVGTLLLQPIQWLVKGTFKALRNIVTVGGLLENIPVVGGFFKALGDVIDTIGEYAGYIAPAIGAFIGYKAFQTTPSPEPPPTLPERLLDNARAAYEGTANFIGNVVDGAKAAGDALVDNAPTVGAVGAVAGTAALVGARANAAAKPPTPPTNTPPSATQNIPLRFGDNFVQSMVNKLGTNNQPLTANEGAVLRDILAEQEKAFGRQKAETVQTLAKQLKNPNVLKRFGGWISDKAINTVTLPSRVISTMTFGLVNLPGHATKQVRAASKEALRSGTLEELKETLKTKFQPDAEAVAKELQARTGRTPTTEPTATKPAATAAEPATTATTAPPKAPATTTNNTAVIPPAEPAVTTGRIGTDPFSEIRRLATFTQETTTTPSTTGVSTRGGATTPGSPPPELPAAPAVEPLHVSKTPSSTSISLAPQLGGESVGALRQPIPPSSSTANAPALPESSLGSQPRTTTPDAPITAGNVATAPEAKLKSPAAPQLKLGSVRAGGLGGTVIAVDNLLSGNATTTDKIFAGSSITLGAVAALAPEFAAKRFKYLGPAGILAGHAAFSQWGKDDKTAGDYVDATLSSGYTASGALLTAGLFPTPAAPILLGKGVLVGAVTLTGDITNRAYKYASAPIITDIAEDYVKLIEPAQLEDHAKLKAKTLTLHDGKTIVLPMIDAQYPAMPQNIFALMADPALDKHPRTGEHAPLNSDTAKLYRMMSYAKLQKNASDKVFLARNPFRDTQFEAVHDSLSEYFKNIETYEDSVRGYIEYAKKFNTEGRAKIIAELKRTSPEMEKDADVLIPKLSDGTGLIDNPPKITADKYPNAYKFLREQVREDIKVEDLSARQQHHLLRSASPLMAAKLYVQRKSLSGDDYEQLKKIHEEYTAYVKDEYVPYTEKLKSFEANIARDKQKIDTFLDAVTQESSRSADAQLTEIAHSSSQPIPQLIADLASGKNPLKGG